MGAPLPSSEHTRVPGGCHHTCQQGAGGHQYQLFHLQHKIKQIPRKTRSGMKGDRQSLQNALLPHCSAAPHQFHCPRCPCRTDAAGRSARGTGSVPRAAQASNRCAPRGLGWAFRTRNKKSGGNEALLVLLLMEQLVLIKKNY